MKQQLTIYLSIAIGILLVGTWLYLIDIREVIDMFHKVNILFLFPLVALFIMMYFLRSIRWKIILSPVVKITTVESFNLCMTNYFINFIIPIHAGEVAKCMLLKKMKKTPVSKSLPSVYIDKVFDLLPILLLLIIAPFLKTEIRSLSYLVFGISVFTLLFFVSSLFFVIYKKKTAIIWIERVFFFLPYSFKIRIRNFLDLLIEGLSSIPLLSNRLLEIIGLTLIAMIIHCFVLWLFFYAFGISLALITALVGYLLLNASFILPAPPGFSGSLELTFVFIFSYLFGYDKNIVSAVAASSHVFMAILFGLFGFICLAVIRTKLTEILKDDASIDRLKSK